MCININGNGSGAGGYYMCININGNGSGAGAYYMCININGNGSGAGGYYMCININGNGSGAGGYYMCININSNGSCGGKGTHVSVFTELLKGHYDSQLHWPFRGTVKVEQLNHLGDNNHHNVTITCSVSDNMRVGSSKGCFYFLPRSSLSHNLATNTQHLFNDSLYFRVSVKVNDHNHGWSARSH